MDIHGRGHFPRLAGGQVLLDRERVAAELAGQDGRFLLARAIGHCRAHGHLRPCRVRQVKFRTEDGVANGQGAGAGDINVAPDADVAPGNGRDPVPSDRGVEGGIVGAEDAAVAYVVLQVHGVNLARIGVGDYPHGQVVVPAEEVGNIELAAGERALDEAEFLSVQPDFSFPIYSVEIEPDLIAHESRWHAE